jgi:tryptophan 2,3-dioxygenase
MTSAAAIRVVALWLGDGPLVVGADPRDGAACVDLEEIMRSLRLVRRWDLFASTKMLVGIQNARVAFTRSAFHLTRTIQAEEISELRSQIVTANFHSANFRAREFGLSARVDALEEELRIREEIIDDLRVEVIELNEAVAEARRADRPEPDPELEPDELMM